MFYCFFQYYSKIAAKLQYFFEICKKNYDYEINIQIQ